VKKEDEELLCLSNVCTHRGNILVHHPGQVKRLLCHYHGRRFNLSGAFQFMPEFEDVENFPRPCDSLTAFPLEKWGPFLFVGLEPAFSLHEVLSKMNERIGFLPLETFRFEPSFSKEYLVNAHWALYCDNYLEGFHIPFVHRELNEVLDYGNYTTLVDDYFSLQIGYASNRGEAFHLPDGHPDSGKMVGAYYYWLFPNMMFNFYPWGLSINIVKPISLTRTRVSFLTYVYDDEKYGQSTAGLIDKVEREDEFVVEGVQKGLRSRAYHRGRYSPTREQGVHHFHRLLCRFLKQE
jgi:choline monooxygenase